MMSKCPSWQVSYNRHSQLHVQYQCILLKWQHFLNIHQTATTKKSLTALDWIDFVTLIKKSDTTKTVIQSKPWKSWTVPPLIITPIILIIKVFWQRKSHICWYLYKMTKLKTQLFIKSGHWWDGIYGQKKKIKVGVGGHFTSFFFYLLHLTSSSYVMDFIVELQCVTHPQPTNRQVLEHKPY